MSNNVVKLSILLLSVLFSLVVLFYLPSIFQEGNPIPLLSGVYELTNSNKDYVRVGEYKYMVKAQTDAEDKFLLYLASKGLTYTDRGGSVLFFKNKDSKNYTANARMYTRSFEVLDFSNQAEQGFKLP